MQGSLPVIAALNEVFANLLSLEQQAHLQEHKFEDMDYSFSSWFDKVESGAHNPCIHEVLKRINGLGGSAVARYAYPVPEAAKNIGKALSNTIEGLETVLRSYNAACEVAEADDDYVTESMIHCHLKWAQKRIGKLEAKADQLKKIGEQAFLAEYL